MKQKKKLLLTACVGGALSVIWLAASLVSMSMLSPLAGEESSQSLLHLLRTAPNPGIPADTGHALKPQGHHPWARPPALEDVVEKARRYLSLQGDLLLSDPSFCCTHGQLFG